MIRVMHEEHSLSEMYLKFLLARSMRSPGRSGRSAFQLQREASGENSTVDGRISVSRGTGTLIPPITQETLAEMIGTTRSRVSFFMNRFRKLGLIEYNGRIRVHKSLLNVVLHDKFTQRNPERPALVRPPRVFDRSRPHAARAVPGLPVISILSEYVYPGSPKSNRYEWDSVKQGGCKCPWINSPTD